MRLRSASRRAGRGIPLWAHLSALVLIPTIGVAALTTVLVRSAVAEADTAISAEAAVRGVAQLDAARSSLQQEIVPVLSIAVLSDPTAVGGLGLPASVQAAQREQSLAAVQQTRDATDAALARVPHDITGAAAAGQAAEELGQLRRQADEQSLSPVQVYVGYLSITAQLTDAQAEAATAATAQQVRSNTAATIRDVQLVSALSQTASQQFPIFLGTQFTVGGASLTERSEWLDKWRAYTDAQRDAADLFSPSLKQEWTQVHDSAAVSSIDGLLAGQAESAEAAPLPVLQVVQLVSGSSARDAAFAGLVSDAADAAEAAAARDRSEANGRRDRILAAGLTFLLLAVAGALLTGRRVARSLRLLADAADEVRRGRLVAVHATGPREVRTVSTALDAAVASLRRIQAQSAAVANGDLTDPVLDQPLPGPLGEIVHASVQAIVESARERERLQSALGHQATHDPLTGLSNRA